MSSLPNLLTLSRILAVPLLAFFLWWPAWRLGYLVAFVLYCVIALTDFLDGYLARAQGTVSKLGIFLDPIADKIMVAAVILVLTAQGYLRGPYAGDVHVIAGLIILVREIAVSGLREFLGGIQVSVPVSRLAKWKTTFQLVALGALILGGGGAWAAVPIGGRGLRLDRRKLGAPGGPHQPVDGGGAHLHHRVGLSARRPQAHGLTARGAGISRRAVLRRAAGNRPRAGSSCARRARFRAWPWGCPPGGRQPACR